MKPLNFPVVAGLFGLTLLTTSLATGQGDSTPQALLSRIEAAHGAQRLRAQRAIAADLPVEFGGQRMIDGSIIFTTDGGRSRLKLKDGTIAIFDGRHAWVSPASSTFTSARFHLLTWPYFALAPFKLGDPGTRLELAGEQTLHDKPHATAKLTFAPGTGDAPDDWYLLYVDPQTARLAAMAYVVTYGKKPGAPEEPHAIVYEDFQTIDGATISTTWKFYNWSPEKGPHGDMIGQATLRNVRFMTPDPGAFDKPPDAREDALPRP